MIRERTRAASALLTLALAFGWRCVADAQEGEAPELPGDESTGDEIPRAESPGAEVKPEVSHEPDEALERYRSSYEALTERAIGQASRRVRFDWRRSPAQLAFNLGLPARLNNYDSLRGGLMARVPVSELMLSFGLNWVSVSGGESSELLALTPYRQPGRPSRFELDVDVAYPVAEGVATAFLGFLPATEMVLNAHARFRYHIYPGSWSDLNLTETLGAVFSPRLSGKEKANLEADRLPGMELETARYETWVGVSHDLYFQSGLFFASQLMLGLPLLFETNLGWGVELNLLFGLAF